MKGAVMKKLLVMVVLAVGVMVSTSFGQNAGVVWTKVKDSPFEKREGGGYNDGAKSVVWGKDRFVASGLVITGNGIAVKIAYSLDGVTWTAANDIPFEVVTSIYWYNGWFIACGSVIDSTGSQNDISAYSSDGITWTSYESDFRFNNIAYGNNKFVAVDDNCNVAYSADGVTWSLALEGDGFSNSFPCVGYAGEMFNVVWGNGTFISIIPYHAYDGPEKRSLYSLDGINWTETGNGLKYVVWGNDKFVASANSSGIIGIGIIYSSDGITWKEVKSKIFGGNTGRYTGPIAWGNNKFIVHVYYDECGEDYCAPRGEKFAYSSDGITWELAKNYPFGKSATSKVVYGNGVFVAVSEDGQIAYSK
jgi:hypothetical protein